MMIVFSGVFSICFPFATHRIRICNKKFSVLCFKVVAGTGIIDAHPQHMQRGHDYHHQQAATREKTKLREKRNKRDKLKNIFYKKFKLCLFERLTIEKRHGMQVYMYFYI